jgi:hypothetical protein
MRRRGLLIAIVWVLASSAVALFGVARNRSGVADAEVVLTERELSLPAPADEENSALSLGLVWSGPRFAYGSTETAPWLDRAKLESLGFDCSYPTNAPSAGEHYGRAIPRSAVLVFEYEGEAWKRALEAKERDTDDKLAKLEGRTDSAAREKQAAGLRRARDGVRAFETRLVAVDAGLDPAELRRKYPDRSRYVLMRGVVNVRIVPEAGKKVGVPQELRGVVGSLFVEALHVPPGQRELFDSLMKDDRKAPVAVAEAVGEDHVPRVRPSRRAPPRYQVRVRWGSRLEPWIVAVEPMPK